MEIRLANTKDINNIQSLVKSLAHYYLDSPQNTLPIWLENSLTEEAILKRFEDESHNIYVGEINYNLVGYISLKRCGHLYHLFVSEQNQNKGYARILWQHAKNLCPANNYWLRSSVFAVPVYKRFGFSESGPIESKDGISFQPMILNESSIVPNA